MITIKYTDPITHLEIEQELDELNTNVPEYLKNLHKNYLCKDSCTGENCKIWLKKDNNYILMGIGD